ncbi:MAG: LamB/YcsF family protein [Opitutaceae bacterium]|nr:LamB/YcsF family protein [Opitutaceae bacterium]
MPRIDLNCDLGEGGDNDHALMEWVTSINVACGGHAGDEATMRRTVAWANERGVAVGAHPGYADRDHFGRRELALTPAEIVQLVTEQVSHLMQISPVRHVKPHGALYNQAGRDPMIAEAIASAVLRLDPRLVLVGLSGGALTAAGRRLGLQVADEVFADRTYEPDGTLTPRSVPGAVHLQASAAVAQVMRLVTLGTVTSRHGTTLPLRADTVCIHGDGTNALEFAKTIHRSLRQAGVDLRPVPS